MGEKLVVGTIENGLQLNRLPPAINNDSFPTLINAYNWRGRIKRKRGTQLLTRLSKFFNSQSISYSSVTTITLDASGIGNLITGFVTLEPNATLYPGTVTITAPGPTIYTDVNKDGTLTPSGSIDYTTGQITIPAQANQAVSAKFVYYPILPKMGLRNFSEPDLEFPSQIAFDTKYAYNIQITTPFYAYNISFYKNPPTGTYTGYTQKGGATPTSWNGETYQQFFTTTYENVLWATNGITLPFDATKIGMQFKNIANITVTSPTQATLNIVGHGLSRGDFVFINEVTSGTKGINFQTGFVSTIPPDVDNVVVTFPSANLTGTGGTGIAQYLTNRSDTTKDCLRWYDGDPTNGNALNPSLTGRKGWVNFCPPLVQSTDANGFTIPTNFSIDELEPDIYYLVGARMIAPFKGRLLFIGPVIQTSSGTTVYLQDSVIYSQDGTPFYTASFQGDPRFPTTIEPLLTPTNKTAFPSAWFEDSAGFGGFITADLGENANTLSTNEDSLIIGFDTNQTRLIFTGNDILPFTFYLINSELGSSSTFSAINMDKGVITRGSRGYILTSQTSAERIDTLIPDQVYELDITNNGTERITAARDFINEWVYFTYIAKGSNTSIYQFPNQTLLYNYRDNSWAIFNETYTTYGQFRQLEGYTWSNIGDKFPKWSSWNEAWNAGSSTLYAPEVVAGNQQGFVLSRIDGTGEAPSLYIKNISGSIITCPDHCLNDDDFILISDCLGTIGAYVNSKIFQVDVIDKDSFQIDPTVPNGTYLGLGLITRFYVPYFQTKQFPSAWGDGRKTRIGVQRYLLSTTEKSQIQLLIFLSQNSASAYNTGLLVPNNATVNSSLIYSTVLYTCPESTNIGLTPANTNLMTPTARNQNQIWHRKNTSLIGDTIQLGFTMSEEQMRKLDPLDVPVTITNITQANPCVITANNEFAVGQLILFSDIQGMTQLNGTYYPVYAATATNFTINIDSTSFDAYTSGGLATPVGPVNQVAEIELHGFIIDIYPSQMLV